MSHDLFAAVGGGPDGLALEHESPGARAGVCTTTRTVPSSAGWSSSRAVKPAPSSPLAGDRLSGGGSRMTRARGNAVRRRSPALAYRPATPPLTGSVG